LPIQVTHENTKLDQAQIEDQEDETFEDKATEEEELTRVQQEIEKFCQEQEAITRR
jgi:hypothetical protein